MIPLFRCRCSAIGLIMAEPKGSFTAKQAEQLKELQKKKAEKIQQGKDITEKQNITLKELKAKKNAPPELAETTKTYLKQWYIEQRFGRRKEFSNKFTEKGTNMEDHSIELLSRVSGKMFIKKNEKFYKNEWITGTPDLLDEIVTDIKSSWDLFTFPLFEAKQTNKLYWYQLQGYMWLTHRTKADLSYCLVDTPESLIYKELQKAQWNANGVMSDEEQAKLEEVTRKNMTFGDIPEELRVKTFHVVRDDAVIEKIKERVLLCREYVKHLEASINDTK